MMELELKQQTLDCFEIAVDCSLTQEESTEMIVPDSCPDISRIVSAEGMVLIRSAEVREGKGEISGVVQVSLLYIPEKTAVLQALDYTLPFLMVEDCPKDCCRLRPSLTVEELSTRALNPRKVLVQCKLGGSLMGYRALSLPYTAEAETEESFSAEKLLRQESLSVITAMEERDFSFEDTLHLPQNRGEAAAILCGRVRPRISEAKIIGKRAVVKGECFAEFLIRYENGRCESGCFELPISQITEIDAPQEGQLQADLHLTAVETKLRLDDDGGSEIQLSLFGKLQLSVTEKRELTILSDLYSTVYETNVERQELQLHDPGEKQLRRQIWQDSLEVGMPPERVLWISVHCGGVSAYRNSGGEAELRSLLRLRVLYAAEEGRILSAERSAELLLPVEEEKEGLCCRAACGEDCSAALTAEGIALRIPVDFTLRKRRMRKISCVKSVSWEEKREKELAHLPSLVLRRKSPEESLWDIAKQHRTASADILLANGCREEGDLPENRLLLIPKRR